LDTDTASPTREIVRVTAVSGNVLTVTRGQDGTSPASFAAGTKVELRLTAALLNDVAGANPSGEPIGFPDKSQTTITFDSGIRTFSITPTGASFDVYCKGVKYTYTTVQLVTIPNTTGLHFIYFSASGVLSTQMSYFTWEEHAPTAYVYWNATTQQAIYFGDERHGITLDWQTHEYLHRTRGAAIANGFAASGYTTTGLGATDADAQIDIGGGTFFDEDMQVDIVSTNTPVAGTWQQDLSGPARIPVMYLSGAAWVIDSPTNFPFKVVSSVPQYNLLSGSTWSTASVTNNSYFVSWILATNNLTYPVISIISQAPTNQLSVAEAMTFEGLSLSGFPSVEFRPLYKVIYQYKDNFANSVKSSTVAVYDLRSISSAGVAAALVQDHGNLSGLTDDDHPQYVHTSEVRTPSAAVKNSFFPSQVGQTGKFLSTNGTNTVWEPPPSGSLSFTGDVTGSGSTGSSVAMTLAASGVVAGQYTKVTVDSKGRVTAGTGVTSADVTSALGYTPYNSTNPAGYTTNVGTVYSVSGTGTVSGLTLTGSVTSSGSLTLGGTLTLTSGQVTTALGYTPYNATNPSGYISGNQAITVSGDASGSGATSIALTLANSGVTAGTYTKVTVDAKGRVTTGASLASGDLPTYTGTITSGQVTTALGYTPYNSTNPSGYITSSALSSYLPLSGGTLTGTLTIGADGGGANFVQRAVNGWQDVLTVWRGGSNVWNLQDSSGSAKVTSGSFFIGSNLALHAGNVSTYALPITGGTLTGLLTSSVAPAAINTTTPGTSNYGFTFNGASSPDNAQAITWTWSSGGGAQAGIYVQSSGAYGTRMYLATTDSFASGAKTAISIDESGNTNIVRGALRQGGNQVLHAGNYTSYSPSLGGSGASGTWSINVTGSAGSASNAGYATYNQILDTRAAQYTPNNYQDYRATYEFTDRFTGLGDWHTAMTLQGWHDGYTAWQIIGPASTSAHENWYLRSGVNTSWNSLRSILHSGNYTSYSPSLTGSGASGTWGISITGSAAQLGGVTASNYFRTDGTYPNSDMNTPVEGYWHVTNAATGLPEGYYGHRWDYDHLNNGQWIAQFYSPTSGDPGLWFRQRRDYSWQTWRKFLDSSNYTSYSPSLTGSGASGTWGISISGSASSLAGGGTINNANFNGTMQFPSGGGGATFGSNHYSMGKDVANGGWSHPHYSDLIIGYHTGIRIGGAYSGVRFYSNSPTTDANNDGNGDGGEALLMTVGGYALGGSVNIVNDCYAYGYRGHSNVAGTGQASYHPAGIYSVGTNWLYGTIIMNGNGISGCGSINGSTPIHAGNYSSYALPLSGGTVTGTLTLNSTLNANDVINLGYNINGSIATSARRGIELHNSGGTDYWIGKRAGAWTQPLDVSFYTGIRYHAHQAYGGHRFYTGGYDSTYSFSVGDGDSNVRVYTSLYVSGDSRGTDVYTTGGWFRNHTNNNGIYWSNTAWHLYPSNANDFYIRSGSNESSLSFLKSDGGVLGYVHFAADLACGFLTNGRGWRFRVDNSGNARCYNNLYLDQNYGHGHVGLYESTRYQGVFFMGDSYKMSADGTSLANMYGIGWSHPNAGGAAGNLTDHGMLIINNGSFRCAISNSIVASGNITAYSDERLKRNWRDMPENFVERLAQVRVGCYERIDDGTQQVGVSAQSLQPLLPEAIQIAKDEIGTLSVSYGNAAMASAVELAKELVMLKKELAEIKSRLH
jgi:hypothetical protein